MKKNSKNKRAGYRNPATLQGASYSPTAVDLTVQAGETVEPSEHIVLQFGDCEISIADITEKVKKNYMDISNGAELKELNIYVKPEDNRAYYVVNGETEGSVELVAN